MIKAVINVPAPRAAVVLAVWSVAMVGVRPVSVRPLRVLAVLSGVVVTFGLDPLDGHLEADDRLELALDVPLGGVGGAPRCRPAALVPGDQRVDRTAQPLRVVVHPGPAGQVHGGIVQGLGQVFGEVVEGLDVVRKIGSTKTGVQDRPVTPIVIQSVTIERS